MNPLTPRYRYRATFKDKSGNQAVEYHETELHTGQFIKQQKRINHYRKLEMVECLNSTQYPHYCLNRKIESYGK